MADTLTVSPASNVTEPAQRPPSPWLRRSFAVLACVVVALVALLVVELVRGPSHSSTQSLRTGATSGSPSDPASLTQRRPAGRHRRGPDALQLRLPPSRQGPGGGPRRTPPAPSPRGTPSISVPAVKPLATKYKVVVVATVLAVTVVDNSNLKQIKVMLFLNQTVTNTQLAAPRVDANRVVLTMVPVGKTWKVAAVSASDRPHSDAGATRFRLP